MKSGIAGSRSYFVQVYELVERVSQLPTHVCRLMLFYYTIFIGFFHSLAESWENIRFQTLTTSAKMHNSKWLTHSINILPPPAAITVII